ncbi:MAG: helix-turn-helix domain-containing protein [Deltaproteobacteria bacterium]|jgi:AraC family ethanolamine operon transcriptional activator|nr:helix-turn-helix domain-containing protein [Deltaproteobacteria bacterium]
MTDSDTVRVGEIVAGDIEELNYAVWPWELDMSQLSLGQLDAHLNFVQLDGILVNRERWSHRVFATGATPPGYLALVGPRTERTFKWCGDEIDSLHVACEFGKTATEFLAPDRSDHWVLLVPLDRITDRIGEAALADAARQRHVLPCDPVISRAIRARVEAVHGTFGRQEDLLDDRRLVDAAVSDLLDSVGTLLIGAHPEGGPSTPRKRYLACRRALHLVDQLTHRISVLELAKAVGVSRRVLERGFHETVGVSPQQYMRWHRLNCLHRELRAGRSPNATVTQLGARWGFSELGRMAGEYRQLFGELPSETLDRDRVLPNTRLVDALAEAPATAP